MTIALEPNDTGSAGFSRNAAASPPNGGCRCSTSWCPSTTSRRPWPIRCAGCTGTCRAVPVHVPDHHRRQRQRRCHAGDRGAAGRRVRRGAGAPAGAEGSRPRAARRLGRLRRPGAGLHGRRPVHRSGRAVAVGRSADLRPFRRRDRHPAVPRLPRGPRTQARVHLALLQPDPAFDAGGPFLRRAVRLQGDPRRRRRSSCCRYVEDTGWFFDTELLVLAERSGLRIHEVPVDWVDDPDSRVDIVSTAVADLKGVARLLNGFATGEIPVRCHCRAVRPGHRRRPHRDRCCARGFCSPRSESSAPLAYLLLFVLLRGVTAPRAPTWSPCW